MQSTSAPKPNNPGTRTVMTADGTRVVVCPGQAVLVSDCLWNRQPWCLGAEDCCVIGPEDFDASDDPF